MLVETADGTGMGLLSSTLEVDELMGSLSRCGLICVFLIFNKLQKSMGTLCSTPILRSRIHYRNPLQE